MNDRNVCLFERYCRLHVSIFSLTALRYFTLDENIIQTCLNRTCTHLIASVQDHDVHIPILLLDIVLRQHFWPKVSIVLSDAGSCMYMKVDVLLLIRNEDCVN
jgi:hypothetical protein